VNVSHEDRRGLTKGKSPEELRKLGGVTGLMLLDLRLCRRDSETIAGDKNLPSVVSWLPEGTEREWLRDWLSADQREQRIAGMEELAAAGEWHELSCHLSGWHDDLEAMQLIYARWDADAPRRNARKKRRKTQEPGVSWQRELANYLHRAGPRTRLAKYRDIPDEYQEPLSLCGGKFEISRRRGESRSGSIGPLVRCEFDDGREPDEISFSTFERYLKNPRSR
jgi:hypothetical protein